MRISKIAALAAATALLVVGSAIAALAATNGWVEESGSWKYYKNGEAQSEIFAKSGDNWYWLDENGEMATDQLVEYNDNYYYVDENGVMVKNTWKSLPNTEDDDFGDHVWYYFQNTGKAYKSAGSLTWKTINGKKYTFNDNGKMLYGWLSSDGSMVSDDDNNAYQTGLFYCGGEDEGDRRTSVWVKYYCVDTGNDIDGDKWFYFGTNGQKVSDVIGKTINGKKYAFSEDGIMEYEWVVTATPATYSSAGYAWFQDAETGAKLVSGWFKTVPDALMNPTDYSNEDTHWYYSDGNGNLAKSTIKSIKGKQYAFNEAGELVTGLQWVVYTDGSYAFTKIDDGSDDSILVDNVIKPELASTSAAQYVSSEKTGLHFFSDDADNDGSMKTGTVTASANGDSYTFKLGTKGTSKGVGVTGKDGNYYYMNGYKLVADSEYKIGLVEHEDNIAVHSPITVSTGLSNNGIKAETYSTALDKYWVVTTSGSIVKSGTKTDSDGYKVKVSGSEIQAIYNTAYDSGDDGYIVYVRQ